MNRDELRAELLKLPLDEFNALTDEVTRTRRAEMFAAFEAQRLPGRIQRWEADVAKVGETDYCRDFTSVISDGFVVHARACPDWPKSFLSSDRCINLTRVKGGWR